MAVSNALPLPSNLIDVDNTSLLAAQVNIDDISILLKNITKGGNLSEKMYQSQKETVSIDANVLNISKTVNNIFMLMKRLDAQQKVLTTNISNIEVVAERLNCFCGRI